MPRRPLISVWGDWCSGYDVWHLLDEIFAPPFSAEVNTVKRGSGTMRMEEETRVSMKKRWDDEEQPTSVTEA